MNVVSFGGGTNSTAMIIGMYLHKIPVDLILFADTGGEQPHTYEFIRVFNAWLEKHRRPRRHRQSQKHQIPQSSRRRCSLLRRHSRKRRRCERHILRRA